MTARMMVPEIKCELDLYEYVLVQTEYVLFTPSMYVLFSQSTYMVHTRMYCVYKKFAADAVLCRMPVGNDTMHA
jgi:hypothetical protein